MGTSGRTLQMMQGVDIISFGPLYMYLGASASSRGNTLSGAAGVEDARLGFMDKTEVM